MALAKRLEVATAGILESSDENVVSEVRLQGRCGPKLPDRWREKFLAQLLYNFIVLRLENCLSARPLPDRVAAK